MLCSRKLDLCKVQVNYFFAISGADGHRHKITNVLANCAYLLFTFADGALFTRFTGINFSCGKFFRISAYSVPVLTDKICIPLVIYGHNASRLAMLNDFTQTFAPVFLYRVNADADDLARIFFLAR